ncbi:hypothetical protein DAPPUDRAFT_260933 [Daphnia pulex]|uniref:Uncharacterized protein n=1 Tax=Daphnia pulex TaxID=6669 RepID=E9HK51_DAPPU|nr:hypothetical protein DAPPUDRAFT_260933 [Daphnia pulex]|eukprot:EFX67892.1 hypothetical protein DAPPUDRAFT_260933 [Daphnia pulex]
MTAFIASQETDSSTSVAADCCRNAQNYFNRHSFQLNSDGISFINDRDVETSNGPAVSSFNRNRRLLVREFTPQDVVRCLDSLSAKRNRRSFHIAFIGDSTILADPLVTSWLFDNLRISFYWRDLIKDDLIADFKRWASTDDDSQAPDFILLGVTAHHIDQNNRSTIADSFRTYEKLLEKQLMPLINQSLTVHPRQEIVWLLQSLTSMDRVNRGFYPETIRMYNNAVRLILKDTRVVMWETINLIVEEYLRGCALTRDERRDNENTDHERVDNGYLNCKDFIHPGMGALSIGTQLIINHICE